MCKFTFLALGEKLYDAGMQNVTCIDFVKEFIERKRIVNEEGRKDIKCLVLLFIL
jgi:hypothetical protein